MPSKHLVEGQPQINPLLVLLCERSNYSSHLLCCLGIGSTPRADSPNCDLPLICVSSSNCWNCVFCAIRKNQSEYSRPKSASEAFWDCYHQLLHRLIDSSRIESTKHHGWLDARLCDQHEHYDVGHPLLEEGEYSCRWRYGTCKLPGVSIWNLCEHLLSARRASRTDQIENG